MSITSQVMAARVGAEPAVVCQVSSGWVVLARMQYLHGYSILMPDPVVPSLNVLAPAQRAAFLCDMALVGDALLEVTGAYRINYAIMGNSDPVLHAHIVPRYQNEQDELRTGGPWSYSPKLVESMVFDPVHDYDLIQHLRAAIQKRL